MSSNQKFAGDEVCFWLEQESSIQLKAASGHGDPVELTSTEAREIASALIAMALKLDELDSPKQYLWANVDFSGDRVEPPPTYATGWK